MPQHNLHNRLHQAQGDILSAISEGPTSLNRFQETWLHLLTDFELESRHNRVDEELSRLAHSTASVVSTLAGSFLRLDATANKQLEHLLRSIENKARKGIQEVKEVSN